MGDWFKCLTTQLERGGTIFFVLLVVLPASVLANNAAHGVAQGAPHRAGLIVRFGNGSVVTRCVTFNEPNIMGLDLLQRAGLAIRVDTNSSIGAGVCKINSLGCDVGKSCFCQCESSTCSYWQYFYLQGGAWKYSNLGASLHQVSDGAVEGWSWGNNVAPPMITLDQICAASASAPTPVTVAPTARPSATIVPSPTSAQTVTPQPATPTEIAQAMVPAASPTSLPSATSLPTLLPTLPPASPTLALTPVVSTSGNGATSSVISYAIFGVIVLSLGAWLLIQSQRKVKRIP
jgi:hypothetical protein